MDSDSDADPRPARIEPVVSEEMEDGTYANFVSVWHSPHEFTLDFAVTLTPRQTEDGLVVPAKVVSRLKISPTLIFDLLRTINHNMTRYEAAFGDIKQLPQNQEPEV